MAQSKAEPHRNVVRRRDQAVRLARLADVERRGNRARALLLTDGDRQEVATRLARLASSGDGRIDSYYPQGLDLPDRSRLVEHRDLLDADRRTQLRRWWQDGAGNLPVWDIAGSGLIKPRYARSSTLRPGLWLYITYGTSYDLAEADPDEPGMRPRADRAIAESSLSSGCDLSLLPHRIGKRLAVAWKLATLGVPSVVTFLGFEQCTEKPGWLFDHYAAELVFRAHTGAAFPVPGGTLEIGDAWMMLQSSTSNIEIPSPCPRCDGTLKKRLWHVPVDPVGSTMDSGYGSGSDVHRDASTYECDRCGRHAALASRGLR